MSPLIFTKKRSKTLIIDTLTAGKPGDNSDTLKEKNHRKEHKNCDKIMIASLITVIMMIRITLHELYGKKHINHKNTNDKDDEN